MSKLKSGKSYSLRELFSGDNDKVVIPDLQRDYCWGNPEYNLVVPFMDTLINMDKSQDLTMGLLYGYYDLLMPDHMQLCDGQQRITTLFLIIGILNRHLNNRYGKLLMSDFELNDDDCEPYLQYSIRESSLYFISDLVYHYFLQKDEDDKRLRRTADITGSYWFMNSYEVDPTVRNILSAMDTIEEKLIGLDTESMIKLGDFITGIHSESPKIMFLYYDMVNRQNGEETFVVINTTGEPLSASQNLKPLMINQYKDSVPDIEDKWEEMETWFWRNRARGTKVQHTSDEGMGEFLRCVRLLESKTDDEYLLAVDSTDKFPYKEISFGRVYEWFKYYSRVYTIDYTERHDGSIAYYHNNQSHYTAEQLYALLPTLSYCDKFSGEVDDVAIKRIYHMFHTVTSYQNVGNDRKNKIIPVRRAIELVDSMSDKDILCLIDAKNLNDQEKAKLLMISSNIIDRDDVELLIAEAETSNIFRGRIKCLIEWSDMSAERFKFYLDKINQLWNGNCDNNIDSLRRALLSLHWNEYPIAVPGKSHFTLGWEWGDWYRFFTHNSEKIKRFLDSDMSVDEYIEQFDDRANPYYFIIKDPKYIACSQRKNLYIHKDIILLMQKERTQAYYYIFWHGQVYPKDLLGGGWGAPWQYADSLLYCDNIRYDLTIDYLYDPKTQNYEILLWRGKHKDRQIFENLEKVTEIGLSPVEKGLEGYSIGYIHDASEAKKKLIEVANWINERAE